MKTLMIYGAAGYTGGMAAEHAATLGLDLVLAGHARSGATLERLAERLGARVAPFSLDDPETVARHVNGSTALLNAAGPFANTAAPLIAGAILAGVHYLDFSAELTSYQHALSLSEQARAAGVMLLPGSGGSVAMLGCLAGHAVARVKAPRAIRIALRISGAMSRGSLASASQHLAARTLRMVEGELVARSPDDIRDFDFGSGPQSAFPVTLPDLLTLRQSTGVLDIETFVHVAGGQFSAPGGADAPPGPDSKERANNRYHATVEVLGQDGKVAQSRLDTVNGYTFTALAAAEAARRVMGGAVVPGLQTPALLFGPGFAETIADTRITDGYP